MAASYQAGDYVKYSCNGVCLVDEIRKDPPTAKHGPKEFYILKPVSKPGATFFVPTDSETLVAKMKPLPSQQEIDQLIHSARDEVLPWITDRKVRSATFLAVVKASELRELLRLVSCLYTQQENLAAKRKKLASSDEAVLRRAEDLIENEVSFVLNLPTDRVAPYIREQMKGA